MRKSVGQAPTAERANKRKKKSCRMSPDIGAEWENHNVGRGPMLDRKGLSYLNHINTLTVHPCGLNFDNTLPYTMYFKFSKVVSFLQAS